MGLIKTGRLDVRQIDQNSPKAALLIGGKSRRMGRPKALLPKGEITLGLYLCQLLEEVTGEPPTLLGEGPMGRHSLKHIKDREPGAGPLSALLGWFDSCPQDNVLILACDMIAMNTSALKWLIEQELGEKAALLPRFSGRTFGEPTAAIYTVLARPFLESHWESGKRGLHDAIPENHRLQPIIPQEHEIAFKGANTIQEMEQFGPRVEH